MKQKRGEKRRIEKKMKQKRACDQIVTINVELLR